MIEKNKVGIRSRFLGIGDWVCQDPWELGARGDCALRSTGSEAGGAVKIRRITREGDQMCLIKFKKVIISVAGLSFETYCLVYSMMLQPRCGLDIRLVKL